MVRNFEPMRYDDALAQVIAHQKHIWGDFYTPMPPLTGLTAQEQANVFLQRARVMRGKIERNEISVFELMRFLQELEVNILLFVIALWGTTGHDVPIADAQMQYIRTCMHSLCAAGYADDEYSIVLIAQDLIYAGTQSHLFADVPREFPKLFTLS